MVTTTPTADLIDQLERDAREKIGGLEREEARLALDALNDDALGEELRDVQSQRASCEAQLRQAEMSRAEIARRQAEAAVDEEVKVRQGHLERARKVLPRLEAAAQAFDAKAAELMTALASYRTLDVALGGELAGAGVKYTKPYAEAPELALSVAMGRANMAGGMRIPAWAVSFPTLAEAIPAHSLDGDIKRERVERELRAAAAVRAREAEAESAGLAEALPPGMRRVVR